VVSGDRNCLGNCYWTTWNRAEGSVSPQKMMFFFELPL
jgi:hypothetical protein